VLQNMTVCTNNTGDFKISITNCTKAIEVDPKAVKAHYLRSVAYFKTQSYDNALEDCKTAIKLNPADKNLRTHFEAIKKEKTQKQAGQKAALKKFFSEGVYNEKEDVKLTRNHDKLPDFSQERVQVYFDIEI